MRRVDADEKSGRNATTLLPSEREGSGVYALDPSSSKSEPLLLDPRGNGGNGKNGSGGGAGSALGAFASGSSRRDNGKAVTTILVLGYMLCSGILNTPQVFADSGVVPATLLYIIAGYGTWLGIVVLVEAADAVARQGHPLANPITGIVTVGTSGRNAAIGNDSASWPPRAGATEREVGEGDVSLLDDIEITYVGKATLGPHGAGLVDSFIILSNFGDICSYVFLVGSLTGSLLEEWVGESASDAWWASFSFVTPVMVILCVFPPCLIRHYSNLRWLVSFSLLAIFSVVLLVIIGGPLYSKEYRSEVDHDPGLDANILWFDWLGSVAKIGSVVFNLSCAPVVLHAYTSMRPRSLRAWRPVAGWAVVIGSLVCYCTGLAGYLSFRDAVNGDILENFTGAVASVFKATMVLHLIVFIPSELVVMRHSLFSLREADVMSASFKKVALVTFAALTVIVSIMVGLDALGIAQGDLFGYLLDISGGVAGSMTCFIFPALMYLGATRDGGYVYNTVEQHPGKAKYRRTCKGLVLFGVIVMIAVPIGVVLDILGF